MKKNARIAVSVFSYAAMTLAPIFARAGTIEYEFHGVVTNVSDLVADHFSTNDSFSFSVKVDSSVLGIADPSSTDARLYEALFSGGLLRIKGSSWSSSAEGFNQLRVHDDQTHNPDFFDLALSMNGPDVGLFSPFFLSILLSDSTVQVFDSGDLPSSAIPIQLFDTAQWKMQFCSVAGRCQEVGGTITSFGVTMIVEIDIVPGSDSNPIHVRGQGLIPVAILTADDFDALELDVSSIAFGPGGAPIAHVRAHVEDVDLDGDFDLVTHFDVAATDLRFGAYEACLTAETDSGVSIQSCDNVMFVSPSDL